MSIHFTSGRRRFSDTAWCFTIDPTEGNLSSGNYYFTLQARNRIGLNLPLQSELISVPTDSNLTITINSNTYNSGENWYDFIISISEIDSLSNFKQIFAVNLKNNDDYFLPSFPINIVLNDDKYLITDEEFCAVDDIDDTDFLNGKIIKCLDTNFFYEFYRGVFLDNSEININQFNTSNGSFKRVISSLKNITDVEDYGGCNLDIRSDLALLDYYKIPTYEINGTDSEVLKFTLDNTQSTALPKGSLISISTLINGQNGAGYLQDSIFVIYKGFVDLTTGVLRTTDLDNNPIDYLNLPIQYDPSSSNLFLPDILNPNEGFIMDVFINLSPLNLSNIFVNKSGLLIYPSISSSFIRYSPFYEIFTEGIIVNKPDYCFLDPTLNGNILLKSGEFIFKGYSITRNFEEEYFLSNNTSQYLAIDTFGIIRNYSLTDIIPSNSIKIARINCLSGTSKISNKLNVTLTNNSSISFVVHLDVQNEKITIRNDYVNIDLRNKRINFPSNILEIYIKKPDNTIVKTTRLLDFLAEQIIEISNLPLTTIDENIINTSTDFGLINPPTLELNEITNGLIPSGNYEIYCSFLYSGLEITDILNTLKIFDLNSLGSGGNNNFNYGIITINSTSDLLLNLQTSLNYQINLIGNCTLQNPIILYIGSTINILIKQDNTGGRTLNFGDFWKFINTSPVISSEPNSTTLIRGLVTSIGIYCEVMKIYDYTPVDDQTGLLNNNINLNNDLILQN